MPTTVPYTGYTSSNEPATVTTTMLDAPTVPSTVPTSAPKVTTPVVSSSLASNYVNEKIVPTMTTAQKNLNDYLAKKNATTIDKKGNADGSFDLYLSDGSRIKQNQDGSVVEKTAEQIIADTPDAGYKFVYNQSGDRTQIPLGETAAQHGMLDNNPTVAPKKPVLDQSELPSGTKIIKYTDGTYGMFDVSGKYIGNATQQQFQNAKDGQDVLTKLNQAVNGNYPLNPNQQAQIDSVKQLYEGLIEEQRTANANFQGGTALAQNLRGIGNTDMGRGAIKGVIDEGISKITDIQSKMNSDVAKMTQAFQDNNITALKDAYTAFSANSKELQNSLDKISSDTQTIVRDAKQQRAQAELAIDNDIRGLIDVASKAIAPQAVIDKMNEALAQHDYVRAAKEGGEYLAGGTGVVGEYYATKRDFEQRNPNMKFMDLDSYMDKDANRKASIARAGAALAAGTDMTTKQQSVFNSIVDKQNKSPLIMASDRAAILKTITDAVAKDPSNAALQVSFVYSMIQALDTYQSAVREGEINLVQGTQGLSEKLGNLPSKIEKGNPLNPSKINEYVAVSKTLTDSIDRAANAKKNVFKAQAISNGIGEQYETWNNTIEELNSKSIGDEHGQTEEEAKASIIKIGNTHPELRSQMVQMQKEGRTYQEIQAWANQQP